MKKDGLRFGSMAALLLPVASPLVARPARAASTPAALTQQIAAGQARARLPGQLSSLFPIDERDPESTVPTPQQRDGNPLEFGYWVQDLLAMAERSAQKNEHAATIRFYRALAAATPTHAQGWSKLCEAYEAANERALALGACKYAIERDGAQLQDFTRFVHLVAAKPGDLVEEERIAVNEALAHLDGQPDLAIPTAHLRCEAAAKMQDSAAMGACTTVLAKAAPDDPKTIVFQWSYAVMRGRQQEASDLVSRAKQAGVPADSLERMSRVTMPSPSRWWSSRLLGFAAAAAVALSFALFAFRRRLRPGV